MLTTPLTSKLNMYVKYSFQSWLICPNLTKICVSVPCESRVCLG